MGSNPRSRPGLPGSRLVINHIQTIIRNSNSSTTNQQVTVEAQSFEEANGPRMSNGAAPPMKYTNNFFTTDLNPRPQNHNLVAPGGTFSRP